MKIHTRVNPRIANCVIFNIRNEYICKKKYLCLRLRKFYSYSLDKQGSYFNKEFSGDPWKAYEDISIRVIEQAIPFDEIIFIVADHITTPKDVKFEVNVKWRINEKLKRLGVAGVCRFDSKCNDLLQVTDLLIGAINYDLKLGTNIIIKGDKYKRRFLEYLKSNIGIKEFIDGFKNRNFNIFIDKDVRRRLPIISG